jgi:dTDP-4-amino-4,6-dideoxygalactose transaminase
VEDIKEIFPTLGPYDLRQTFDKLGYALKMTDIQAALGIEQLKKA